MADEESEQKRIARVKELEEMVRKLENENKQLLNKVRRFVSKLTYRSYVTDINVYYRFKPIVQSIKRLLGSSRM